MSFHCGGLVQRQAAQAMAGYLLRNGVDWLDTAKRNAPALAGLALTEYGALGGKRKITWSYLGRYALCGGGFLSTFWLSHYLLFRGYTKAGYEIGMGSAVLAAGSSLFLNFTPGCRFAILAGSVTVFFTHLSRYSAFNQKRNQTAE